MKQHKIQNYNRIPVVIYSKQDLESFAYSESYLFNKLEPALKYYNKELKNLELLELSGSNELPNLSFIKELKNLKTFIFSMNVKNMVYLTMYFLKTIEIHFCLLFCGLKCLQQVERI